MLDIGSFFVAGFAFALLVRLAVLYLHRGIFRQGFFGDSSVHWNLFRAVKGDGDKYTIPQYLMGEPPHAYPVLFHEFSSLFSEDVVRQKPWCPNLVLFALFVGGFTAYSAYIFSLAGTENVLFAALLSALFFVSMVSNLSFDGPSIAYLKFSERLMARLLVSAYFFTLVMGLSSPSLQPLILSVIFGSLSANASKFGRQVVVFVTPLVALLALDLYPLLILVFSSLGALAFGRQHFLRTVKAQLKHIQLYENEIKNSQTTKATLSHFIKPSILFDKKLRVKERVKRFMKAEPIRGVSRFPEIPIILLTTFFYKGIYDTAELSVLIATILVYLITATARFNHFGEAYRYLEYGLSFLLPFMMVKLILFVSLPNILIAIYVLCCVLLSVFLNIAAKSYRSYEGDVLNAFLSKIELHENDVVFPVSMRLGADICARVPSKSFWWQPGGGATKEVFDKFIEEYPYLKKQWRALATEFSVTYVLVDKLELAKIDWSYDFGDLKVIHETDRYLAYKV